jgi:PPM family protein phosphatase
MTGTSCPECREPCEPGDRFCEACGTPLWPSAGEAGRQETDLGALVAISDRGRVRARNEDAYAVLVEDGYMAAVVCDGVSTTDDSGRAAAAASGTALATLSSGLAQPGTWTRLAVAAVVDANRTLRPIGSTGERCPDPGSTTIALALVRAGEVVVANVGDSRAYWIGRDGESVLLTVDDSWEHFAREAGLPDVEAMDPARAHEITAWLGPDADPPVPHVACYQPTGDGFVVVCSDGLWNYANGPDELAALVRGLDEQTPAGVANELVRAALDAGGADNVTVAVAAARPFAGSLAPLRPSAGTTASPREE